VTVISRDLLVGYSFGHPMAPGRWWGGCTPAPRDVLNSSKFAVIELDVRKEYRRQGIAKTLLDMLLSDRGENFATLASTPGSIANAMYKRWGWYKVGEFTDSMEALLIPLRDQ
jgi:ribosomal protein S18 acetylase RimI-like enzyme